ncbi:hypothetical protein AB0I81_38040 [Nonomuraea sp. NPDC050404]|uniref:hypothetical protein n=1 Tax=Nonomuraea sp. NPDC050404 TaxID=3155783 RepID=UPI0033FA1809
MTYSEHDLHTLLAERSEQGPGGPLDPAAFARRGRRIRARRAGIGLGAAGAALAAAFWLIPAGTTTVVPAPAANGGTGLPQSVRVAEHDLVLVAEQPGRSPSTAVTYRPKSATVGMWVKCAVPGSMYYYSATSNKVTSSGFRKCGDPPSVEGRITGAEAWMSKPQKIEYWVFAADVPIYTDVDNKCDFEIKCEGKYTTFGLEDREVADKLAAQYPGGSYTAGVYEPRNP